MIKSISNVSFKNETTPAPQKKVNYSSAGAVGVASALTGFGIMEAFDKFDLAKKVADNKDNLAKGLKKLPWKNMGYGAALGVGAGLIHYALRGKTERNEKNKLNYADGATVVGAGTFGIAEAVSKSKLSKNIAEKSAETITALAKKSSVKNIIISLAAFVASGVAFFLAGKEK